MNTLHHFHIPVMGLAYTIDSPIKVAHFGIASVISIVEDRLIETMRQYYYAQTGKTFVPISSREDDYRAKRITDYLNLVHEIVKDKVAKIKAAAFEEGGTLVKYFEMLPTNSPVRQLYLQFIGEKDEVKREAQAERLKQFVVPGSIDVNIMTKVDKENYNKAGAVLEHGSDAVAALRGYMNSNLTNSSVIFSAGMNPRHYNYLETFPQVQAKGFGEFEKKIIIKVSDYRSALIQGKYLAKKASG